MGDLHLANDGAGITRTPHPDVDASVSGRESHLNDRQSQAILRLAMDGFWITDGAGRLLEVNDAYCRMSGFTRAELLRLRIADLEAVETPAETQAHMQRVRETGADRFESRHRRKDGSVYDIEASVQYQPDSGGQFFAFVRDITAVKQTQAQSRKAVELLQTVIDHSQYLFYGKDRDGRFILASQSLADFFGQPSPAHLIGKTSHDFLPKEVADRHRANDLMVMAGRELRRMEEFAETADGMHTFLTTKFPLFDDAGEVYAVCGASVDITDRKRMETQLRESRATLNMILDTVPQSIFWKDLEGRYLGCNRVFAAAVGLDDPARIVGLTDFDLPWPRAEAEAYRADDREVIATNRPKLHIIEPLQQADGVRLWIDTSKVPLRDADGRPFGVLGVYEDITERKRAEEALRQNAQDLRASQSIAHLGSWYLDLATNAVVWTEELYKMYGFDPTRPPPPYTEHMKLFTPESWERLSKSLACTRETGIPYELELETVRADGGNGWIWARGEVVRDADGRTIGLWGAAQDITERKRVEEALRKSEEALQRQIELFSALMKNLPIGVFMVEAPSGKPLLANDAAGRLLGRGVLPDAKRENLAEVYQAFKLATGQPYPPEEMPIVRGMSGQSAHVDDMLLRRPDGSEVLLEVVGTPVADEQGRVWASLVSFLDITERKRADEQIRQLNAELEQRVAERTAQLTAANKELEAFAYSVSHDLRAPLRAIDGFSRILVDEYSQNLVPEARRYLELVHANVLQMDLLVNGLLDFARLSRQPLRKETVQPAELLRHLIEERRAEWEPRQMQIKLNALPPCAADPLLLKQVLSNLLDNALKFTRGKKDARIELAALTGREYRSAAARPHTAVDLSLIQPETVIYRCSDNGVGFDLRYADKLFGVFQRLHRAEEYEGTGVGLAMVQRIVQRHGGQIWAESAPNAGAIFYFHL